jgi:hypothetical protein
MDATPQTNGNTHVSEWVFVRRFRHWRSGQWVYRKNGGFFRFRLY